MSDISVIGLGRMGAALTTTLLRSGRTVTVWNRTAEKAAPLVDAGATLASSPEDAIAASEATIVCIKTHKTTTELLKPLSAQLNGKTILDLSTGGAKEAKELVEMLSAAGAQWHIGMINAYPSGIGKKETAILCAGPPEVWARWSEAIRVLGGASAHVGTESTSIPGLFGRHGHSTPRLYVWAHLRRRSMPESRPADRRLCRANAAYARHGARLRGPFYTHGANP